MPVTIHKKHEVAKHFLLEHPVGVLATVTPGGDPHAAAIYFTTNKDLRISFITKAGTKKADNLRVNNHAVLVVFNPMMQSTVQITGEVSEIKDAKETQDVFAKILTASIKVSNTSLPPITKLDEGDYIAFHLTPKEIRMAEFSKPEFGKYEDLFQTIVPE